MQISIHVADQKCPSIVADRPFIQLKAAVSPTAWIITQSAIRHQAMRSFESIDNQMKSSNNYLNAAVRAIGPRSHVVITQKVDSESNPDLSLLNLRYCRRQVLIRTTIGQGRLAPIPMGKRAIRVFIIFAPVPKNSAFRVWKCRFFAVIRNPPYRRANSQLADPVKNFF